MDDDEGNDLVPAARRDAPGGAQEAQRSWASVLANDANQVAVGVATAAALYGAKKAVDKIRKPPPSRQPQRRVPGAVPL